MLQMFSQGTFSTSDIYICPFYTNLLANIIDVCGSDLEYFVNIYLF